jgi:transcriptional regulator with XRE-family HTH domain
LTIPPSRPGSAGRAALAARLATLRKVAGLSGNALAKRMGVVQSRVWKIEHGDLLPGEQDIKEWMRATGAEAAAGELADLLAAARSEQQFGTALRRKGGAAAYEERVRAVEEAHTRIGEFEVAVIPGILQTEHYAREVLSVSSGPRAWGSDDADVEDKISVRLRRQEILYGTAKRVQVVISEAALRILVTSPEAMAGQLDKLLAVSRLPAVGLGVIAYSQRMPAYAIGGFRVYDDDLIVVESISGERDITDPDEVAVYLGAFDALRHAATTGEDARTLIASAAADLREG